MIRLVFDNSGRAWPCKLSALMVAIFRWAWPAAVMTVICISIVGCHRTATTGTDKSAAAIHPASCDNAYFPISPNIRLEYQSTFSVPGIPAYSYVVTFTNNSDGSFERHEEFSAPEGSPDSLEGSDLVTQWRCEKDGLIATTYGDLSIPDSKVKLKTAKFVGTTLPPSDHWQKGTKWNCIYNVTGQMTFKGAPRPIDVTGIISINNEVGSEEKITVPAGAYSALKITSLYTQQLKLNDSQAPPVTMKFGVNSWYAKDVGLVKSSSDEFRVTTALNSITR